MKLHLGHLYAKTMNTYGDSGNIICLKQRCQWRGIEIEAHELEVGDPIPNQIDLYFFGGGQDAAQNSLEADLTHKKGERIKTDAEKGIPVLAICGGYQLLGHSYQPFEAPPIQGVGLFPVTTAASSDRMIGDLIITANPELNLDSSHPTIVGFENHSGKTTFLKGQPVKPLGSVRHGFGNNGQDKTEGCLIYNSIGCYLHGSLLPKNPHLADWLILKACQQIDPTFTLSPLDNTLEWQAHDYMVGRYK